MARVFFIYSHRDEPVRDQLDAHLASLRREGLIETWHDRQLGPGAHVDRSISTELEQADIILLLVSADFLDSEYCVEIELSRALEKHAAGEAVVIPVIVRPCDWHGTRFGRLNAVPRDGKPISIAPDRDAALLEVAHAVRQAASRCEAGAPDRAGSSPGTMASARGAAAPATRAVRVKKNFSDHDRDQFLDEAFEHMMEYFEEGLRQLERQDADFKTRFRGGGEDVFTAAVYVRGEVKAECRVWRDGRHIAFSWNVRNTHGGVNEQLTVHDDAYQLLLRPLGMATLGTQPAEMTKDQAAEYYWKLLLRPLTR